MNFADLAHPDVEERCGAVVLLPVAATEPYGSHVPLATDTLSEKMAPMEAYCAAPVEATAEKGHATFETLTDLLVELIREGAAS